MRIAMIGTRGAPARYGGFETAVEEIGQRLVARGHDVTVYCRDALDRRSEYLGMRLVHLPALHWCPAETLTHSALSIAHMLAEQCQDVAVVFNAANAPFLPALWASGIPAAVHVDGLEWKRAKWGGAGRHYYRMAEKLAVRWGDALIADADGIATYYREEFGATTELLTYGAPLQYDVASDRIERIGLERLGYHLVVARFEPENHVAEIVAGYRRSVARRPLIVVGSAPYSDAYTARVRELAANDPRIRILGGIWDQGLLDQLYANALTYVHGHSVGGTNPSLLRAMGAGTAVIAFDVVFNREVLGPDGVFFTDESSLPDALIDAEADPVGRVRAGDRLRDRAAGRYQWDQVADGYEQLLKRLDAGESQRSVFTGRRRGARRKR
jgi:glycosyltransferase involved in cell wall biosynthesis